MSHDHRRSNSDRPLLAAIAVILVAFVAATIAGKTDPHANGRAVGHAAESRDGHDEEPENQERGQDAKAIEKNDGGYDSNSPVVSHPDLYAVTPFVLLLGAIAIFPLLRFTNHWWESNRNRFIAAIALSLVTIAYYGFIYEHGGGTKVLHMLEHAVLREYFPFIVLLFSLYTISGGIRISGNVRPRPLTNTIFIGFGGLLASFIGTTGAAMLLIRPLLDTNRNRNHVQHTVVFFIFVACNCGGCLLPIGDPPLFLGYLRGVAFLWTMHALLLPWFVVNFALLAIYFAWDRFICFPREEKPDNLTDETEPNPLSVAGLWPNVLLLLGIIFSIALLDPSKPFPGTGGWKPCLYLREVVQIGLVGLSLLLGSKQIRIENKFSYDAIVEVASLFIGIFICMQPVIEILRIEGKQLGVDTPRKAFWATGGLSAVLDNAPTYVVFYKTAQSQTERFFPNADPSVPGDTFAESVSLAGAKAVEMTHEGETIGVDKVRARNDAAMAMLVGISLGAVFMGAMTYIGNGPNFMVRAIAEESGVKMPSFFGYVFFYSAPILLPVFFVTAYMFLN
jgi:Na+/H+ antiporter NhaD/arsenite permease-like protein